MRKLLLRQLRRSLGITDEGALETFLKQLEGTGDIADPAMAALCRNFADFLGRVESTYEQYERDLELKSRSLELSSQELSDLNGKLRHELNEREGALNSLRKVVQELLPKAQSDRAEELAGEDLAAISQRLTTLVKAHGASQRELANQKFALDQHAIVSITDTTGCIVYANDRFCEISGYALAELIGENHRIVKSAEHPASFFREMWETISSGKVWHGEVCNRKRTGELYWVSATIVPLLGLDGLPEQYIGIRTDISDRKQMEVQLSEQLDLVEGLLEAIPLPVYLKDAGGRYLRLNRAFELFFDTKRERFIGKTLHDLLTPEDARIHVEKDREIMQRGGMQSYETVVHGRDGIRHDTIYRKAVLTRRDGSIHALLGVIIDITERKQAEAEMKLARDAAEAASRSKSEFLANMSHEIRTPMNGIIGMTDLALDTTLDDEQREYLAIVKSSADALLTIINDILDFSKIEAGKLLVEEISYNLHRVVSETLKTLALKAHEKNLELVCDTLPEVPEYVLGDPGRLRQVLTNLIGNAIKFTEQGEITLRVCLKADASYQPTVQFSVSDTGIGIAPDKQRHIFEAFAQEDSSTTRRYGGTGLGLSISRRLVELMGGEMWLDSTLGQGSTFHFTLALAIDEFPQQVRQQAYVDLSGKRILVVDDNDTNRRVIAGMLTTWDVDSVVTNGAAEAQAQLAAADTPFDCIILDAHMPEMDGYELAAHLKQTLPDLPPMLMLSSGAMRGDAQRCREIGILGFFSKPISAEELLAALSRIFGLEEDIRGSSLPNPLVTRHSVTELQRSLDILLVEDHPVNQRLAVSLLEKWGHRVTVSGDGQQAVAQVTTRSFDLVLMDMQMPVMGGIEATHLIRQHEHVNGLPRLPIIAMTAAAMKGDRESCLEAGMDDYISKPIKAKVLLEKLMLYGDQMYTLEALPQGFDYAQALESADRETVEIIAQVFIEIWPQDLAKLNEGLAQEDIGLVERTAHSLKGTLATFNAAPAMQIAADIEARAHAGKLTGLTVEFDALAHEVECLIAELANF